MNLENNSLRHSYSLMGTFTLALRLVLGWTYFSAFWRRLILNNKLDPDMPGYIGEKFNHFLPNALAIKPLIKYLVTHPDALHTAMVTFTIIEALVGLFLLLGLFTRIMSIGVIALAFGILLGSGWLGTTCLDEWQIGVLGIAGGFTVFLSGSGTLSLDTLLRQKRYFATTKTKCFNWLGSGVLPVSLKKLNIISITGAILVLGITLFTNQYFHGGVWGTLHNKSVKPLVEISNASLAENGLNFTVYRIEGADVYGSFLIDISLKNDKGDTIYNLSGKELTKLSNNNIYNEYIAKVKPNKHSLVIPLGAKAIIKLEDKIFTNIPPSNYELVLTDISGIEWKKDILLK